MRTFFRLYILLAGISVFFNPVTLFSQAGKDGAETVLVSGAIFNRYTTLSVSAGAADLSIFVSNIADLSGTAIAGVSNNPYATSALTPGDLIMIIKMQGALINTTNTINYGAITDNRNTGIYELKVVTAVAGNQISFCSGLTHAFAIGGTERVQVVRVPRLSSLTVNAGASLTARAWDGTYTGGVLAMEVNGNATVNGTIQVNGLGYRGGVVEYLTSVPGVSGFVSTLSTQGGEKGEGMAGYQADYDASGGRYGRGAPANGGGGGNSHNAGGGGGANAQSGGNWTGQGVMVVNASNLLAAWALDPGYIANANALTNSPGGGRGGYSYGVLNADATVTPPGGIAWGGDYHREVGGLGGRATTYTSNMLLMGGGGGAGDANNNDSQNGANGGGIIYMLVKGNLNGTGSITANGANAASSINTHKDAVGGGGGGGAIELNVQGTIAPMNITANGGTGGNHLNTTTESEGPGGGGGGGAIRTTGSPSVSATGGANGTSISPAVTELTSIGATAGAGGAIVPSLNFVPITPVFNPVAPVCAGLSISPLPVTSVNGINGSWSPAFNNNATTTYTFIPASGACDNTTTLTITILPRPAATVIYHN